MYLMILVVFIDTRTQTNNDFDIFLTVYDKKKNVSCKMFRLKCSLWLHTEGLRYKNFILIVLYQALINKQRILLYCKYFF